MVPESACEDDKLLKYNEATEYLRISKTKLYRLAQERKIPFVKFGGNIRFKKSDLKQYIEDCTVEPKQVG